MRLLLTAVLLSVMTACSSLDSWTIPALTGDNRTPSLALEKSLDATRKHYRQTAATHGLSNNSDDSAAFQRVFDDIDGIIQYGKNLGWIVNEQEAVMVETAFLLSYYIHAISRGDWSVEYVSSELHRLATLPDGAILSIAITNSVGVITWSAPRERNERGRKLGPEYKELLKDQIPMLVETVSSNGTQRVGVAGVDRPRIVLVEFKVEP